MILYQAFCSCIRVAVCLPMFFPNKTNLNTLYGAAPRYLRDCCTSTHSSASGLRLRSLERTDLHVWRMKTHFGDRAFTVAGVLEDGTVSRLLPVSLTQWAHLKPSLKLVCLL